MHRLEGRKLSSLLQKENIAVGKMTYYALDDWRIILVSAARIGNKRLPPLLPTTQILQTCCGFGLASHLKGTVASTL